MSQSTKLLSTDKNAATPVETIHVLMSKGSQVRILSIAMLSLALLFGASANAQDVSAYPPLNGGQSATYPADHYKFTDTKIRGVDGKTKLEVSDAFGDGFNGKHGTFVTFDAGFVSQVHSHTYDYYGIVIKGTVENYEVGVTPIKMGPGSYWYQRGKKAHTTSCVSKTGCLIFLVQSNKFDGVVPPVED